MFVDTIRIKECKSRIFLSLQFHYYETLQVITNIQFIR